MPSMKISLMEKSYLPIFLYGNKLIFEEYLEEVQPDVRTLAEMKPVLKDDKISSPEECYYMYRGVCKEEHREIIERSGLRYDITVIPPLFLGEEFNKTFGHYHPKQGETETSYPEVYEVIYGKAHYILQSEDFSRFIVIEAKAGDKVLIPPNFGHVTINPGRECLVMSNWVYAGFKSDYSVFQKKKGAIYYETKFGLSENRNYSFIPPIEYADPQDLSKIGFEEGPMYLMVNHLDRLSFLAEPDKHKYKLASLGP